MQKCNWQRKPDVVVVKIQNRCVIMDVASSADQAVLRMANLVPVIIILSIKQYSRDQVTLFSGSLVRQMSYQMSSCQTVKNVKLSALMYD